MTTETPNGVRGKRPARRPTVHAQTVRTLRKRVAELEWVGEMSQRVNAARTLDDLLDTMYDGIRHGLGYDRVGIALADHAAQRMEGVRGTDDQGRKIDHPGHCWSLAPDGPAWRFPLLRAAAQGARFYCSADIGAEMDPDLLAVYDGLPKHTLAVTIVTGTTLVGLISVDNLTSGRPIAPEQAGPLVALANHAGTVIERLREHARSQQLAREAERHAAQLAASEEQIRSLMDAAPIGMCILDEHGTFERVNAAYAAMLGYTPKELEGRPFDVVFDEAERALALDAFRRNMESGVQSVSERVLRCKDGSPRTALGSSIPLPGHDGSARRALFAVDIEERKRAEDLVAASEARFRALTEYGSDVVRIIDAGGTIRYASASHRRVLGYDPVEVLGHTSFDFMHPDDVGRARAALAALVAEGGMRYLTSRTRHAGGSYHTFETILHNRMDDPAVQGIVVNARDVTERLAAEAARRESEAAYRLAFDEAAIGMSMTSLDNRYVRVNQAFCRMFGYREDELIGAPIELITNPEDWPLSRGHIARVLEGATGSAQFEKRYRHKDGHTVWVQITISLVRDEDGRPAYFANQLVDITERVAAEAALRASEERYREVERYAPIGLALVGVDGRWLRVNPALCALVGYSEEELLTSTFQDITHPDDLDADLEYVRQVLAGESATFQMEKRYIRKDGSQVWTLLSVSLVRDREGRPEYFISQIQDLSERKRVEDALDAARRLADHRAAAFATLVEVGAAFAAARDPHALCRLAVARLADRFGYDLVSIYLREGDQLRLQAQHGYDTVLDPLPVQGRGVAARTVRTGITQFVPDAAGDPDFIRAMPGIVAEICVPLVMGGQAAGILSVESCVPGALDDKARELLELMAMQLAVALENDALQLEEHRRTERLAALQSMTAALAAARTPAAVARVAVERGRAAVGAAAAIVRLLTADGDWVALIASAGYGAEDPRIRARLPVTADHPACQVVRSGKPLWSRAQAEFQAHFADDDASSHVASNLEAAAILPLIVDDHPIGILGLSFATPQSFEQADRDFLLTMANATAQALERARLDAAERERARAAEELARLRAAQAAEAEAMATISAALSRTLEPAQLYTLILEQAVRLLPSDHATVLLHEGGWATVAATWGSPAPAVGTRLFPIAGKERPWQPADHPGAVYVPDTVAEPAWRDYPPFVGIHQIRSTLAAPLVIDGETVGTLNLHSSVPGYYGEQQLPLATAFAERVCQALRNARLYQAEQERRRAAEDLAQMRSDFLSAVSHELRTPLTAIVGFGELLQERRHVMDEARLSSYLERIITSANRQLRLVQDLMETSRAEAGRLRCLRATLQVRPLVERAAAEVQAVYPGQRIDLDGPAAAQVEADPERTLQILINLIDNAAKYSSEGSPIAVTWGQDGDRLVVRVRDHGPGISEANRGSLFTRFGRLPGSRARAGRTSTGLGLHLSRLLGEAMGGDLALEDSGPDGSTFRLRLPLPEATGAHDPLSSNSAP